MYLHPIPFFFHPTFSYFISQPNQQTLHNSIIRFIIVIVITIFFFRSVRPKLPSLPIDFTKFCTGFVTRVFFTFFLTLFSEVFVYLLSLLSVILEMLFLRYFARGWVGGWIQLRA